MEEVTQTQSVKLPESDPQVVLKSIKIAKIIKVLGWIFFGLCLLSGLIVGIIAAKNAAHDIQYDYYRGYVETHNIGRGIGVYFATFLPYVIGGSMILLLCYLYWSVIRLLANIATNTHK